MVELGVALLVVAAVPYLLFGVVYAWFRPSGSPIEKAPYEPTVSIVLPTYNEAGIVERKLADVAALDYPSEKLELVVVDASDDRTPDIVASYFEGVEDAPTVRVIREESRKGLAVALNEGYAAASNEIIVKTDCDSTVAPDALREAMANFADPAVGGVTGRTGEVLGGSEVESDYRGIQGHIQTLESHLDSTFIFHGPFSAFRRDLVVPVDSDSLADDSELALRIRRGGHRVVFDPAVRYSEAAHSGFRQRRTQKDRRAMGLIRLLTRQASALGRHGWYGRAVLPFNWLFMIVGPWLLALGLTVLTVGSLLSFGVAGAALPAALAAFVAVGSRDALGPLQPFYALFDTQVSLLHAGLALQFTSADGLWEPEAELREAFD
nr:glycosyltransferase [Halomarina salina]